MGVEPTPIGEPWPDYWRKSRSANSLYLPSSRFFFVSSAVCLAASPADFAASPAAWATSPAFSTAEAAMSFAAAFAAPAASLVCCLAASNVCSTFVVAAAADSLAASIAFPSVFCSAGFSLLHALNPRLATIAPAATHKANPVSLLLFCFMESLLGDGVRFILVAFEVVIAIVSLPVIHKQEGLMKVAVGVFDDCSVREEGRLLVRGISILCFLVGAVSAIDWDHGASHETRFI